MFIFKEAKEWVKVPFMQLPQHALTLPEKTLMKVLPQRNPDMVPICERYTLSISEAAQYFGIGQVRLRSIIHANPNADFLLMVGNRLQIKRKKFEAFIDDMSVI